MLKLIRKYLEVQKLKKKIRTLLPNYHPDSGIKFNWQIHLGYESFSHYDVNTGKPVNLAFVPKLTILHKASGHGVDNYHYSFSWGTKRFERVGRERMFV